MKDLDLSVFSEIDKNQWTQLAENQLKGEDPNQVMKWETSGISVDGFYDQSDLKGLEYLHNFFSTIKSHRWKLYEAVKVSNQKIANTQTLNALMGGCDGVILDIQNEQDLEATLKNVDVGICDINIKSDSKINRPDLTGFRLTPNDNSLSSLASNPVQQICELFANTADEKFIYRVALKDFFLEIATVRALRYLLDQKGFEGVHIHTHIPLHDSEEHQWFLNTTAGLASILGGSHSIDLSTSIGDSRISRNTGNLIREESGIKEYADQCGGSYYVEVLTDKIIQAVSEKLK